jgi:hypothetical protein
MAGGPTVKTRGPAVSAIIVALIGVGLSLLGYALGQVTFNPDEVVGPLVFWCGLIFLVLAVLFREATLTFARYVRRSFGLGIFVFYVAIHLLLYGFVLDAVLASVYGAGPYASGAGFFVTTNLFTPISLASMVFDLAYNPVIVVTAPPIFSAALTFYSIALALIIGVLVVANVGKTKELGEAQMATSKARTFVILPALGVVLGASCCLSVAGLVSLASPTATFLASSPWIYYTTYFLFPCIAVAILYLNLRSIGRMSAGLGSP